MASGVKGKFRIKNEECRMKKKDTEKTFVGLPGIVQEYIKQVLKGMRFHKKAKAETAAELAGHFEDELRECKSEEEREKKAEKLIADFGDAKMLGKLIKRGKKRCRPMWLKVIILLGQVIGIIILYLAICAGWLFVGEPTIKVDYIERLNQQVSEGRDEKLNAKTDFDKAGELVKSEWSGFLQNQRADYWPGDMNEAQKDALVKMHEENKEALEILRKAAEKPYYWTTYTRDTNLLPEEVKKMEKGQPAIYNSAVLVTNASKGLNDYRKVAKAMGYEILYRAYIGDIEGALSDSAVLIKLGGYQQGKGLLIEQLVGTAIEGLAQARIFAVLGKADVPSEGLKRLQEELEKEYCKQKEVISLEGEKTFWYDWIQLGFTDDGKGNGRILKDGLLLGAGTRKSTFLWRFVSFSYPDRQEFTATMERYFELMKSMMEKTPWQINNGEFDIDEMNEIGKECMMCKPLAPGIERSGQIIGRLKTGRAGLLGVIAVLRYKKDKGTYPENLEELVTTGYLKEIPMDAYSDKALVYRKAADGFTLYSVGQNFKDDGGEVVMTKEGRVRQFADDGDWVFWPVER